jgi:hypothetical protein
MRLANVLTVIGFLVGLGISLLAVPAVAAVGWTPEQEEIIDTMEQWHTAWDAEDVKTLDKILADEIEFTNSNYKEYHPAGEATFKDKKSLLNAYGRFKAADRSRLHTLRITTTKVTYIEVKVSGEEASVTRQLDRWTRQGSRIYTGTVTRTAGLKKLNGEWRLCADK